MTKAQLFDNILRTQSFLCVGLDTDINKLPRHLLVADANPVLAFNKAIIDATAPHCVAYKLNTAFYESNGAAGWQALEDTIGYLKSRYPNHFVIADAKRGDIGNTTDAYVCAFLEHLKVDAVTLSPYMGKDSVEPYLNCKCAPESWVILLALTSNPGAQDFQMITTDNGDRLFERVIKQSQQWADDQRMMYVAGATRPQLLRDIRRLAPNHFLLVPGVGAQGGSLEDVAQYAMNDQCGLLVNSSRAIIYADSGDNYAAVAGQQAHILQQKMAACLRAKGLI